MILNETRRLVVFFLWMASIAHAQSAISAPPATTTRDGWPYHVAVDYFEIHSTVPLDEMQEPLNRLRSLRTDVSSTLNIPLSDEPIHIAIFRDRIEFDQYVKHYFPTAPERRALFIRDRGNGLVLTYCQEQWHVDVRHECVHAMLHAAAKGEGNSASIPLWLDEGLAEYFEVEGSHPEQHPIHGPSVRTKLRYGQVCEIDTLESIGATAQFTPTDYRDSWSAVNLLIHHSAASRLALQSYLQDILAGRARGLISHRIRIAIPDWREEFRMFYRNPPVESISRASPQP